MAKTILKLYDIHSLCSLLGTRQIVVPDFQRRFVWRESQIIDLLRSIYKGYPIGTIILSDEPIAADVPLREGGRSDQAVKIPSDLPRWSVVDGVQRLEALYNVFFAKDTKVHVFFDLQMEKFVRPRKVLTRNLIDLHALYSADGLLQFQKRAFARNDNDRDRLLDKINNLYRAFKDYQIPVQVITDISTDDAVSIFRSLNTTGMRLTKSELQRALNATKTRSKRQ